MVHRRHRHRFRRSSTDKFNPSLSWRGSLSPFGLSRFEKHLIALDNECTSHDNMIL